ncbi:MAG TPA: ankyrin repeat domain-containing protein [Fimbriimonas sp.]
MTLTEAITAGDVQAARDAFAAGETAVEGAPSAILLAAYYGKHEVAEALRAAKGQLDIFEAAAMGDLHVLESILLSDPHAHQAHSTDGFTPLGYAAYFGHLEAVRLLLRKGASPNVASENPLHVTPLHSALDQGRKEMARALVENGADVNASQGDGWTPLHYCAQNGDVETAKFLLDHGARGDEPNRAGAFPADLAEKAGYAALAEILRPKSA